MEKHTPYTLAVRYYETDRMRIVHHSNYIRWFEEARVDFMRQSGYPYDRLEAEGVLLPVLGVSAEFKRHLTFGDKAEARIMITDFNGVKFNVQYKVTNVETGELCVIGSSAHCFTNDRLFPLRIGKSKPEVFKIFSEANNANLYE